MSNLSIESQVAELSRDALAAMFANINDKIEITSLAERLRTDLKAIARASCCTTLGVFQRSALVRENRGDLDGDGQGMH